MSSSFSSDPQFVPRPEPLFEGQPARAAHAAFSKVAIVGFGTVGRSVARIITSHPRAPLRLTHICNRNVGRKRVTWLSPRVHWTEDFEEVLRSDVDVVVEVVGGLSPAGEWVRRALESGKSVVTANKQLIAHHGPELTQLARKHGCRLAFGASVAGGVPVVSGLQEGLAGDELYKISGILNGTCNYILSRIEQDGVSFEEALREAQKLGYAEADPTDDVEGLDARAKLAILVRVALHTELHPTGVHCRSIAGVDAVDFAYAHDLNCTIRQVSRAELKDDFLYAAVQPVLAPESSPLARVQGCQNLVMATGRFGGETVFSGHGAGGDPTAVAVVSDLLALHAARDSGAPSDHIAPPTYRPVSSDFTSRHYLRFTIQDRPGILATLAGILSRFGINIDAVLQKPGFPKYRLPFVMTLEECNASVLDQALGEINALEFLVQPTLQLPILGEP